MRPVVPLLCGSLLIALLATSAHASSILCLLGAPQAADRAAHQAWWLDTLLPQLARAGHNLTVLTSLVPHTSSAEYGASIRYIPIDDVRQPDRPTRVSAKRWWSFATDVWADSVYDRIVGRFSAAGATDTALVQSSGVAELLNRSASTQFDLILHDHGQSPVLLGFVQHFGHAPLVSASPTAAASAATLGALAGVASFGSYVPHPASAYDASAELALLERARNASYDLFEWFYRRFVYMRNANRKARQVFGDYVQSLEELEQRAELVLANLAFGVDAARLLPPNVLAVGGLQAQRNQRIAPELRCFLDGAADGGVVYVNLGARLEDAWRRLLTQVFAQLPEYRFVWYTEGRRLNFLPKNVYGAGELLPQAEILGKRYIILSIYMNKKTNMVHCFPAHPNTRLVITNGGRLSVQEAIWNALPLLAILETNEQRHQLAGARLARCAETMLMQAGQTIESEQLVRQVRAMLLKNTQYAQNARRFRAIVFGSQFGTPLDRATHGIEYVLATGGDAHSLRLRNRHLHFWQTYLLDVSALIALLVVGFVTIFVKNCCCQKSGRSAASERASVELKAKSE